LSNLGLLFCYHRLLSLGFYNNTISFAVWFWAAGWWWRKRDDLTFGDLLIMAGLLLLAYSAHPMGLTFTGLMSGAMLTGLFLYEWKNDGRASAVPVFFRRLSALFLAALPALLLFAEFAFRRQWSADANPPNISGTLENIGRVSSLISMNSTERDLAISTGVVCLLFFAGALVLRRRARQWAPADGLLLFLFLIFYAVLKPPASMSGGLEVPMRMVMLPYFAMLFWSATAAFPLWSKALAQLSSVVIAVGFLGARLPIHHRASDYAKEVFSISAHVGDPATILTLNYDWGGQTPDGQAIANRVWLFNHVDCYLGAARSAAISDNYEANYWYFPTIARWNTNMYSQTDKERINFDHRPPRADILNYKQRTGQNIDYVLLLSYREEFKEHAYTKEIFAQLEQAYDRVFVSEFGRAILYKRKGL
jgi:hypothetical protein